MAARRRDGLEPDQVADLRRRLADGGRPRVQVLASQFGDRSAATVVRIGDPQTDGADFIRVRLKVNGVSDELGFAPEELQLPGRTAPPTKPAPRKSARRAKASPAPPASPVSPASSASSASPASASSVTEDPAKSAPRAARGRRRGAATPPVTITIASSGSAAELAWNVTVSRGARAVAKGVEIPPGAVTRIAQLLDVPAVTEAVDEVNSAALAVAQDRAERLRAELAELDAILATHRRPG
jgi:hypothetical protein